ERPIMQQMACVPRPAGESRFAWGVILLLALPLAVYGQMGWRFWTAADGMAESYSQSVGIAPDGTAWIRHGQVSTKPEAVLREAPSAAIGPLRLLVAEDNVVNQKVACPDVILMDVQMHLNGRSDARNGRSGSDRGDPAEGKRARRAHPDHRPDRARLVRRPRKVSTGRDGRVSGEAHAQGRPDTRSGRNDGCVPPGCSASRRAPQPHTKTLKYA